MSASVASKHAGVGRMRDTLRAIPPAMLGFALVRAWATWTNVSGESAAVSSWPLSVRGTMTVALLAFLIGFARERYGGTGASRGRFAEMPPAIQPIVGAVAAGATLASVAGVAVPGIVCACAYGAGQAVFYLAWGSLYARMPLRHAFACVLATYILGAIVNGALYFVPDAVQPYVAAPLLFAGACLYVPAARSVGSSPASVPAAGSVSTAGSTLPRVIASAPMPVPAAGSQPHVGLVPVVKFASCLFVYGGVLSVLQGFLPLQQGPLAETLMHVVEIVLAAAFFVGVFALGRPMRFAPLLMVLYGALSSALVLTGLGSIDVALVLYKITHSFLTIVLWTVAVDLCQRTDRHPYAVIALLFLARNLAGYLLFLAEPLTGDAARGGVATIVVALWLLSFATLLFATEKDLTALRLFGGLFEPRPAPSGVAEVNERCARLAVEFGLTAREEEVVTLLCLGKSKAYAARELGLTEATVKSHTRNAYAKLDVHSKNELQELVGL